MITITRGTISTVAGTGEAGYAGDGGPAVHARLNEPKGVTVTEEALYIADSENHRIRKVDRVTGIIMTVAGSGSSVTLTHPSPRGTHCSSDAMGHREGEGEGAESDLLAEPSPQRGQEYLQMSDQSGTVRFVTGSAEKGRFKGDGGPATEAILNFPSAVAVDSHGNLYIADTFNHRIRFVEAATGRITTLAGTGRARFGGDEGPADKAMLNEPVALALDENRRRLFIADLANYRVRVVDLKNKTITTYTGNGQSDYDGDGERAIQAALSGPSGLALDAEGNLYISDTFSGRIRLVEVETGLIRTVAGDGTEYRYQGAPNEFSTGLSRPAAIALAADGAIYITDSDNHLIRRWSSKTKIITSIAGNGSAQFAGDGGPAANCGLNYPFGVALDRIGNLYIADTFNHRIRMIAGPPA